MVKVKTVLGNRTVFEFGGTKPNPRYETLMKEVEVVRSENIIFILAMGSCPIVTI